jgi:hypothetical protein
LNDIVLLPDGCCVVAVVGALPDAAGGTPEEVSSF